MILQRWEANPRDKHRFMFIRWLGVRLRFAGYWWTLTWGDAPEIWNAPHFDRTPMERKMTLKEGPRVIFHGNRMAGACSGQSSSGRRFSDC